MSELSKTILSTKFNDSGTGLFKDAQAIPISRQRTYVTDMNDSAAFMADLGIISITSIDGLAYTGSAATPLPGAATSEYLDNPRLWVFYCGGPNSGAVTVNIDGAGAVSIKKVIDNPSSPHADLESGDIGYGTILTCYWLSSSGYFVCSASLLSGSGGDDSVTTTIATGAVLTGFASPVSLVAAPGAGRCNVPTSVTLSMDYNSVAYATNVVVEILSGSTIIIPDIYGFLDASADRVVYAATLSAQCEINAAILFRVQTGNPTLGNSAVKVKVKYQTITI